MEQTIRPKSLLMKVDDKDLIKKVVNARNPNKQINLTPSKTEKIVNKIIAYEYLVNNYILDENSVEFIKQDIDGVWCSWLRDNTLQYAKVWFSSANPNLRKIFFNGGKI